MCFRRSETSINRACNQSLSALINTLTGSLTCSAYVPTIRIGVLWRVGIPLEVGCEAQRRPPVVERLRGGGGGRLLFDGDSRIIELVGMQEQHNTDSKP